MGRSERCEGWSDGGGRGWSIWHRGGDGGKK